MSEPAVILFLGGSTADEIGPTDVPGLEPSPSTIVVAADSGFHRARAAGLEPHHLIGDLDSIDPGLLDEVTARIHRHSADKDATDAELALRFVCSDLGLEPNGELLVIGDPGGRLDHLLADVDLITSDLTRSLRVSARLGATAVDVLRGGDTIDLRGRVGETISLLARGGPATGVMTAGLRWPLVDATLRPGSTRGMSNEFDGGEASVRVSTGVLLVVRPGDVDPAPNDRADSYDPSPR